MTLKIKSQNSIPEKEKRKLALFTPLPPKFSGIADYCLQLIPYLAKEFQIDVILDDYPWDFPKPTELYNTLHHLSFPLIFNSAPYWCIIYQIGNNVLSNYMYPYMANYPGILDLHDSNLHLARATHFLSLQDSEGYQAEMRYSHGKGADSIAIIIGKGFESDLLLRQFPMIKIPIAASRGVIVHSQFVADEVKAVDPKKEVQLIPLPFKHPAPEFYDHPVENFKNEFHIPKDARPLIGSFGLVTHHKRLEVVFSALNKLKDDFPQILLLIVGPVMEGYKLDELIEKYDVGKHVRILGKVEYIKMFALMHTVDFAINLRYPTYGETSATLINILGCGTPAIISNLRQFAAFPSDFCFKVDVHFGEEEQLIAFIKLLAQNENLRKEAGKKAKNFILQNHNMDKIAELYLSTIKNFARKKLLPLTTREKELSHLILSRPIITDLANLKEIFKEEKDFLWFNNFLNHSLDI